MATFTTAVHRLALIAALVVLAGPVNQAQTIETHNTGTVLLDVYDNGIIGAGAEFTTPGFFYNGLDGLFEGQLIVGASDTQVSGSPYDVDGHEWRSLSATTAITSPFPAYPDAYQSSYDDFNATNPIGIEVTQRSFSSTSAGIEDYVLIEFQLTNTSGGALTGLYAGLFADYDVGDFTMNLGDYDAATQLVHVWDNTATNTNWYGTVALMAAGLPVSGWNVDVGEGANPTEANTYSSLNTFDTTPATPDDRRTMIGVGPFDLGVSETQSVWFALVAGDTENDLLSNAAAAQAAPVPVELVSFNAVLNGSDVTLNWATSSETNNAGFELQMDSGNGYQAVSFIEGHGTTTEAQSYEHTINDMAPGTYMFRLKQIDYDGVFEIHQEIEVTVETPDQFVLLPAYPNPFNPQATVRFAVRDAAPVTLTLHDALGRVVSTLYDGIPEANQTLDVEIDGSNLPSGVYLVRLSSSSYSASQSVTLLK